MSGEFEPGTVFAGYVIERVLGRGGMGTVYLAQHPNLPRKIALKLLDTSWTNDDYVRSRFESEADHAAHLDHPNIVTVHDRGREGGRLWIAMQYVPGTDARKALGSGALDVERAVHIVSETGRALDHAHEAGILHRDVKPANILLAPGDPERVLLTDFGTAKALDETHQLTRTGVLVATLHYAAPEQIEGEKLDHRVDIYALGCTFFHLLTNEPPYPGNTASSVMHGHLNGPIPQPSVVRPGLPAGVDAVVARAMAKNREARYSTCREFSDAIRAIEWAGPGHVTRPAALVDPAATTRASGPDVTRPDTERGAAPTKPTTVGGSRRRKRWLLAALLGVLVVAAVAYVAWPGEESTSAQVVLPLTDLQGPAGLAVSGTGDLYIADSAAKQVLKVSAGTYAQTALPFTGLEVPQGVAVSTSGVVYVSDLVTNTVTMLHGSTQVPMPFGGLNQPFGIALGPDATLYVADTLNNRVMALRDVTAAPVAVPLTVIGPFAVAVNEHGDLYVGTPNKVLTWNAATHAQSFLPFTDLQSVGGVAVDDEGTVYAIDQNHNRILRLAAGSDEQEVLPFSGLDQPEGIAVSSRGDVYVADTDNSRVVMLPAGS
ncbi:serine/threonine-protein kinase PknD [Rhodococcus opacus]|uniref:serine/threonine-protein kinase PknD n=1 Tax=Rhodococcus opacus TaxID=37919 RepID=UPI0002A3F7F9|nr:serine/threonine-protein kinase PknD [Rhodococcus opacus]ELB94093.1 protein kinase [Rhodococcus wratislaviensis IFP 2016]MDX5968774.1 serine/threonine-protein kinase PknD [Rhodococcus opacus]NKY70875.1 protein kinase [Rhodococcus opacus]CAG7590418.1 Serine/threonine-protein kinase PknD [Rhodococcus opacus]